LPPAIVKVWDEATQKILADPEYRKAYLEDDLIPHYMAHDQYGPFITKFAADTGAYLKSTGVIR
jgi:tripartite-type tricarboxylate transporter receptor subunit TctC